MSPSRHAGIRDTVASVHRPLPTGQKPSALARKLWLIAACCSGVLVPGHIGTGAGADAPARPIIVPEAPPNLHFRHLYRQTNITGHADQHIPIK